MSILKHRGNRVKSSLLSAFVFIALFPYATMAQGQSSSAKSTGNQSAKSKYLRIIISDLGVEQWNKELWEEFKDTDGHLDPDLLERQPHVLRTRAVISLHNRDLIPIVMPDKAPEAPEEWYRLRDQSRQVVFDRAQKAIAAGDSVIEVCLVQNTTTGENMGNPVLSRNKPDAIRRWETEVLKGTYDAQRELNARGVSTETTIFAGGQGARIITEVIPILSRDGEMSAISVILVDPRSSQHAVLETSGVMNGRLVVIITKGDTLGVGIMSNTAADPDSARKVQEIDPRIRIIWAQTAEEQRVLDVGVYKHLLPVRSDGATAPIYVREMSRGKYRSPQVLDLRGILTGEKSTVAEPVGPWQAATTSEIPSLKSLPSAGSLSSPANTDRHPSAPSELAVSKNVTIPRDNNIGVKARLTVRSDVLCRVSIDNRPMEILEPKQSRTFRLATGEHLVLAVSIDGFDQWRQTVVVPKGGRKEISINLLDLKRGREQAELERQRITMEIASLKGEIERTEKQATEARAEREKLAAKGRAEREKEETLQHQVDQIVNQISIYEKQMGEELTQAIRDEEAASKASGYAANAASRHSKLGKVTAVIGTLAAVAKSQSAAKHRQRAQQLLTEIQRRTHELYILTKE